MTREELYQKAKVVYQEVVTLEQDLDQLAEDFSFDKETNVSGLDKKEVKATMKAAEVYVRNSIDKEEDKIVKAKEFIEVYKELTGEY